MRTYDLEKEFLHKDNCGKGIIYNQLEGKFDVTVELNSSEITDLQTGLNISIDNNVISALGYTYNPSYESITIGSEYNTATGFLSFALGDSTDATGEKAHAEGSLTVASGNASHAEGHYTTASGSCAHSEGDGTVASNEGSHAEGYLTKASGQYSHAEGYNTKSFGSYVHAEGRDVIAKGECSHAEGYGSIMMPTITVYEYGNSEYFTDFQMLEFYSPIKLQSDNRQLDVVDIEPIDGSDSLLYKFKVSLYGKYKTITPGDYTIYYNTGSYGKGSHVEGLGNITHNEGEHALGVYNISHRASDTFGDEGNTIHSIGIGDSDGDKNAQEVMQNGDHYIIGIGNYDGTNIETAKTLQEVINELSSKEIPVIEGYEFDSELNSFRIGREITLGEIELLLPATLSMGNTPSIFAKDVVASWQKDTNIIQFTEGEYNSVSPVPGSVLQLNTNNDKLICKIVDRNPELYQITLDKNIPFDHIENISTIAFLHNVAYGKYSVANPLNTASGAFSHALGYATTAGGGVSHSEGTVTYAIGISSHAEGIGSVAYELGSHAEGITTKACGEGSHTEGVYTEAKGNYSHAEGNTNQAVGEGSHVEGYENIANNAYEHTQGIMNKSNSNDDLSIYTIDSIGIGKEDEGIRRNGTEVMNNGDVYIIGVGGYDGTNPFESKTVQQVLNEILEKIG